MKTPEEMARIVVQLIDPRATDQELADLAGSLDDVQDLRDLVVALGAVHSACVDDAVSRTSLDMDQYLRLMEQGFLENMYAVEEIQAEGGAFL